MEAVRATILNLVEQWKLGLKSSREDGLRFEGAIEAAGLIVNVIDREAAKINTTQAVEEPNGTSAES